MCSSDLAGPGDVERRAERRRGARNNARREHIENAISFERVEDALRSVDRQRLRLAQAEEARDMVDIAVRQGDRFDRARTRAVLGGRGQLRRRCDLLAQIGRGVEEKPVLTVAADRCRGLRSRDISGSAAAHRAAISAIAIPLRKPAAGARSEN